MTDSERHQELITAHKHRRHALQKRRALQGWSADPALDLEIQEIDQEIERLEGQLEPDTLYHYVLILYPTQFREEFGGELVELFIRQRDEAGERYGLLGVAKVWATEVTQLPKSVMKERLDAARRKASGGNRRSWVGRGGITLISSIATATLLLSIVGIIILSISDNIILSISVSLGLHFISLSTAHLIVRRIRTLLLAAERKA